MTRIQTRSRRLAPRGLAAGLVALLAAAPPAPPAAHAAPQGEQVVHGDASFSREGSLTVIRPSDGAIIQYQGFDILRGETVQFIQPTAQSRVLNRVYGDATHIDGSLLANGIVYLVNPAGVFYGRDAIVNVGKLVTAAGDIADHDFLRGVDAFSLSGPVENLGGIRAQAVSLLGRSVVNRGSIVAPDGVIALVAGERVVLTQLDGGIAVEVEGPAAGAGTGIEQAGLVDAGAGTARFAVGDHYSLAINHSGVTRARDIELRGGAGGLVQVSGGLDASALVPGGRGGDIRVLGDLVALVGATLDASGESGGGAIRVGGDLRGQGLLPVSRRTFVDGDSWLRADALGTGDGGSVVVFSQEATGFFGTLSARGGLFGGDGGFAELSSRGRLIESGHVDLLAPAGIAGTLLYDPQDIVIVGGTLDGSDSPDTASDRLAGDGGTAGSILFADVGTGEPFSIYESELEGTNANIVLEARNSITTSGTFSHDAGGEGAGVVAILPGNSLTMRTQNAAGDETGSPMAPGIDLTGSAHGTALEFRTAGTGTITLETGTGTTDGAEAPIKVGVLTTAGRDVGLTTEDGAIEVNRITTSGAPGASGTAAGAIRLDAGDQDGDGTTHVTVAGDLTARGGDGSSGTGGAGGIVAIRTRAKPDPVPLPDPPPPPAGGGPITIGGTLDASGGSGPAGGGAGGRVVLEADVQGAMTLADVVSRGGDALDPMAASSGGAGGAISIDAINGDIHVGTVDSSGGATDASTGDQGGAAGNMGVRAGIDPDTAGAIQLAGYLRALGGAGAGGTAGAGGNVQVRAGGSIEHMGQAGPQIATQGNVVINGANVGALAPIEVSGGGTPEGQLGVGAKGTARVAVTEPGFNDIEVLARDAAADIQVTQGTDVVRVNASQIEAIDTTQSGADVVVELHDDLDKAADVALSLRVRTGSVVAGGNLRIMSEDDIVFGDGDGTAITMRALPPDPANPTAEKVSGVLGLVADDDADKSGAVLDGVAGAGAGRIDLVGNADRAGGMIASASTGVGASGDPIVVQGGGAVTAETTESGGVFLRNEGSGDLTLGVPSSPVTSAGVAVLKGAGNVDVENAAGNLVVQRSVFTSGDTMKQGGDVALRVAPGSKITLAVPSPRFAIDSNGNQTLAGDVTLREDARLRSRGDVDFQGAIDTELDPMRPGRVRSLSVERPADDTSMTVRLAGDVGVANDVRDFTVRGDLALTGDRQLDATNVVTLDGNVYASGGDDSASLAVLAGPQVLLGGDVGASGRLTSFSIARNTAPPFPQTLPDPVIRFTGTGAQQIVTGAGGLALLPDGRSSVPSTATISKAAGDLRLESVGGAVNIGENEKLTVAGRVDLLGSTVEVGDVSALDLSVTSPDARVRARPAGIVQLKGGGTGQDGGTDLFANSISFSSAPTVEGSGPAPRLATDSATNPGTLEVRSLESPISASDLFRGTVPLDLAILPSSPGNETPLRGPLIDGIALLRTSDEAATGSALAPTAEETLAWLRCAAEERSDCKAVPESPLDTPRGQDLAQRARDLLGSSVGAHDARAALARLEPGALRSLAVLLVEVRLLGLSNQEYAAVRDALLADLLAGAGSGAPDARALASAVQTQARGVPL